VRNDAGRLTALAKEVGVGVPAARQILEGLGAAWRDARYELDGPLLLESKLRNIEDVQVGEVLRGVVRTPHMEYWRERYRYYIDVDIYIYIYIYVYYIYLYLYICLFICMSVGMCVGG